MATHEHTIVVDRPVTTVYDQWTQFESYPHFMDNVDSVQQVDDAMTHWKVSVAGVEREYDAQILEQSPPQVIAWQSVSGPRQAGRVSFSPIDPERTRVTLRLDFEPHGVTENVGEAIGVVSSSVEGSLQRFKQYLEDRDGADGGWRGTIADGVPVRPSGSVVPDSYGTDPGMAAPIDIRDADDTWGAPGTVGESRDLR